MTDQVAQAALDRALDEKEDLLLVYQPIHDARTRAIVAAEALLRQRRQTGEVREASIITEAAEEGPEMFELDWLTMRQAFEDATRWQKYADVRLNINLSPREFEEGNLPDRMTALLSACGVSAAKVSLEITETSYIERPEETVKTLDELKRLGLGLWLDDFGTGHSSIAHLQHFPLDGLKVPGDFIANVVTDRRDQAITRSLISLAHDLGMKVIAEEIERQEQLQFLIDCGCDYIQGFLFNKPMEIEQFEETLRT